MQVSISDAARLAGVSRQTLYDRINAGTLSRTPEKKIDVAELARVYPDLKPLESLQIKSVKKDSDKAGQAQDNATGELLAAREAELQWMRIELERRAEIISKKDKELSLAAERIHESNQQWQEHMSGLRQDFSRLLEAPEPEPVKQGFWKRVFG